MANLTFDSGMKLLVSNQHETLYARSIDALRRNERNPLAFFFLGILASTIGQDVKALELFAKATEHAPRSVRYQSHHAKAFMTLGLKAEAKLRADIAAEIETDDAFLIDMIGSVYSRAGFHDLALPLFARATELKPKWAGFHFNLAASAQFLGQFDLAEEAYGKAISNDPRLYESWFALVGLRTQTADDDKLEKLISLFDGECGNANARLLLGHAIAKTLEDLDRYEDSFDWLQKAKALRRQQVNYSRDDLSRTFNAARTAPAIPLVIAPEPNSTPIFVIGLPRTGTTLVDRILSSHRDVASVGELNMFPRLINRSMGISEAKPASKTIFQASPDHLESAARTYVSHLNGLGMGAKHIVDKTPHNFLYASLIHRMLPYARIIAMRRGAMDSCLSNYRQLFALNNRQYDYTYDVENLAHYYHEFDSLIRHWRESLPTNRFTEVQYEDIVFDQENQTRRLLSFCDLEWDEACLRFHENAAPVDSASSVQVRRGLNADGIDRWKKYGKKIDILKVALDRLRVE